MHNPITPQGLKQRIGLSQDALKLLACLTMLIDHIGAIFFPGLQWMRLIGRISFPLYAFLLSEGVYHTRNARQYALRLILILVITELPYDLLFRGELTWKKNSAMVTLFWGFCIGVCMKKLPPGANCWRFCPLPLFPGTPTELMACMAC